MWCVCVYVSVCVCVFIRARTNTEIWLQIFVPNMPRVFEYSVLDDFRYWLALYKHCGC